MIIKKFTTILALLISFSSFLDAKVKLINIENYGDHFHNMFEYSYVIAIFLRKNISNTELKNIEILKEDIIKQKFLQDENIALEIIDFRKDEYLNSHYKFKDENNLTLFIQNQMIRLKGFQSMIEKEGLDFKPIKEFLHTKIKGISQEVYSLDNLDQILDQQNIIGLFIGNQGKEYQQYFKLAQQNIDFHFYHSFNKDLIDILNKKFNQKIHWNSLMIIRHNQLLDEYDQAQLISFKNIKEFDQLKKFFEFERHPKLRDGSFYSNTLQDIIWKEHKVLLYVQDRQVNEKNLNEFLKAINRIPKQFIFKIVDIGSEDWRHITQILEIHGDQLQAETVCIIYVDEEKKFKVEKLNKLFEEDGIIKFAQQFESFEPKIIEQEFTDEL